MPLATQIAILAFMLISSNGAAGVSGAGLVTLAASIAAFDHIIPMVGLALIVGIDRFMSEGRALTNLTGNGIGTLAIARWTGALDRDRLREVLDDPRSVDVDELMKEDSVDMAEQYDDTELKPSSRLMDSKTDIALGRPYAESAAAAAEEAAEAAARAAANARAAEQVEAGAGPSRS